MAKLKPVMDQTKLKTEIKKVAAEPVDFKVLKATEATSEGEIPVGFYLGTSMSNDYSADKKSYKKHKVYVGTIRRSAKFPKKRFLLDVTDFGEIKKIAPPCFKLAGLTYSVLPYVPNVEEPGLSDEEQAAGEDGESVDQVRPTVPPLKMPTVEEIQTYVQRLDTRLKLYTQQPGHKPELAKPVSDKLDEVRRLTALIPPDTLRAKGLCLEILEDVKSLGAPVVPPLDIPKLDQLQTVYQKQDSDLTNYTRISGHDDEYAAKVRLKLNQVDQMLKVDPKNAQPLEIKALCLEIGQDLKALPAPMLPPKPGELAATWQKLDLQLKTYENLPRHDDVYAKNVRTELTQIDQLIKSGDNSMDTKKRLKKIEAAITKAPAQTPISTPLDPALVKRSKALTETVMKLQEKHSEFVKEIIHELAVALDPGKNIVDRDAVLDAIEDKIIKKQNEKEGEAPPLSPEQQKLKNKLDSANNFEAERELKVIRLGAVLSPEIIAIMNEHKEKLTPETKAFAGVRFMDDLFAIKSTDPEKAKEERQKRLEKVELIAKALAAVKNRRQRLGAAINNNPGFQPPDKGAPDGRLDEVKEGVELVRGFWMNMANHIPDEFAIYTQERDFGDRLQVLKDMLNKTDVERRTAIDGVANVPQKDKDEERKAFLDAIGEGSLKPAELTAFYFDVPVRALTPEQLKAVMKANEKIIQRGYQIHDMGGTVADIEKSLAHIPEEFWPPQFVEDLQAWRKVEREMAEERVAEMNADPEKLKAMDIFGAVTGTAGLLGDLMSLVGGCSDLAKSVQIEMQYQDLHSMGLSNQQILDQNGWKDMAKNGTITADQYKALEDYKGIGGPLDGPKLSDGQQVGKDVRFVLEEMKEITKALNPIVKASDPDNMTLKERFSSIPDKDLVMIVGKLATITSKVKNIGGVSSAGSAGATFATNICPVLAAVGSGLDLASVCMELKDICKDRKIAVDQQELNELNFYSGQNTDKAMVGALCNERNARNRQRTKKRVEVAAKAISFTGDAIGTGAMGDPTGACLATQYSLKIIGKTIELGNKVVFAGIDWSIAVKSMKLLEEAQAGNPVARVEIFKECGLYAKMYICVAARDGSPVAKQYIIDRGLTEGDLTKPMALKVLRNKLLKKSDQKDESKNTNLGGVMVESLMGAETRKVGNRAIDKAGEGIDSLGKKIRQKFPGPKYNPDAWKPPSPSALTKSEWETEKKKAVDNGLAMADKGLGAALDKLLEGERKAGTAMGIVTNGENEKKARKQLVGQAITACQGVADLVGSMDPATNEGGEYPEMLNYLADIRSQAFTRLNSWNDAYYDPKVGAKNKNWKPPKIGLAAADWDRNWQDVVANCMLENDQGVGKALKAYEAAKNSPDKTAREPAKVRKAKLAERDALKSLAEALSACSGTAGEFPNVVAYCNTLLTATIKASQAVNGDLITGPWQGSPKGTGADAAFKPDFVDTVFKSATTQGFMKGGDQGLLKALRKLTEAKDKLDQLPDRKTEEIGAARATLIECGAEVARSVAKIRKENVETHQDFSEFLDLLEKTAHARCQVARDAFAKITFKSKVSMAESDWNESYGNAVTAGAVPKNDGAKKKLAEAFANYVKARKSYVDEKKPADKLVKANATLATMNKIQDAAQFVGNQFGFENPEMVKYLGELQKLVGTEILEVDFQKVLGGKVDDHDFTPPKTFLWEHKAWTNIKDQAVKLGLIAPKDTGFGKMLDTSKDSYNNWSLAKTADKAKTRDAATADLQRTFAVSKLVKSKNDKLVAYMKLFVAEAKNRAAALAYTIQE